MDSTLNAEPTSAIPPETRARINRLVNTLLERYSVTEPPVPIERMLKQPLDGLWDAHPSQISFIMGHGLYRYAPRLAEARLLYRLLSDSVPARQAELDTPWPASRRTIKYFARCLLMPEEWIRALPPPDRTPDAVSEIFQVTSYDAVIRLAELGLPVPADVVIPPDE
ncbi:hypothetical protein TFLX_04515 [Thermoflexales bacterium]|nr:hypothetical protein TFLX_04515 [Thermoflexales bacterium]